MHIVIKGCNSISEYKEKRMKLTELAESAYNAHKNAFDNWNKGEAIKAWEDNEGCLCIEYENGEWWHYSGDNKNGFKWW